MLPIQAATSLTPQQKIERALSVPHPLPADFILLSDCNLGSSGEKQGYVGVVDLSVIEAAEKLKPGLEFRPEI